MFLQTVILMAIAALGNTSHEDEVYDTIIVGMGASGCAAASVLCRAGKNVLGLEAQDKVGGRVYTAPLGDGFVEQGAEWIFGTHPSPVYDLAVENNLSLISQQIDSQIYRSDGSKTDEDLILELIDYSFSAYADRPLQPQSQGQHLTERVTDYIREHHLSLLEDNEFMDYLFHYLELVVCANDGLYSWNDITTHDTYVQLDGDLNLSIRRGFKTIFEILLNTYQDGSGYPNLNLQLEKVVTRITHPQDPEEDVEVTCEDGSTYWARNVIVTVALGFLKESYDTIFSPGLPESKIGAIKEISVGMITKLILLFPNQWWEETGSDIFLFFWRTEDIQDEERDWTFNIPGALVPMGNRNALAVWSTGATAELVETMDEDDVRRGAMKLLRRFMGRNRTVPEPIEIMRSSWHSNPYTRGTLSYGNLRTPLYPNIRANLSEPLVDSSGYPRVLFAGEATNKRHFATVHGALETGYRESARLLAADEI